MTVTELSALGLPSILIPYPYAMDNHQLFNARFLEVKGGAIIINNKDRSKKSPDAVTSRPAPGPLSTSG